jgi:PASTA domain
MPSQFETPTQFEQILRNGSRVVADAIRPTDVKSVRARGDHRRRRQFIGSVGAVLVIGGAGSAALTHLATAGSVRTPAPITTHRSHQVSPTVVALIMPNAVGLSEQAAVSLLTAAGLHVITGIGTCNVQVTPVGTICQTSPAAATIVTAGATVVIEVSR